MLRQALVVSLVVSAAGLYGQTAKPESPKETTSPVRPADVKKSATPKKSRRPLCSGATARNV